MKNALYLQINPIAFVGDLTQIITFSFETRMDIMISTEDMVKAQNTKSISRNFLPRSWLNIVLTLISNATFNESNEGKNKKIPEYS